MRTPKEAASQFRLGAIKKGQDGNMYKVVKGWSRVSLGKGGKAVTTRSKKKTKAKTSRGPLTLQKIKYKTRATSKWQLPPQHLKKIEDYLLSPVSSVINFPRQNYLQSYISHSGDFHRNDRLQGILDSIVRNAPQLGQPETLYRVDHKEQSHYVETLVSTTKVGFKQGLEEFFIDWLQHPYHIGKIKNYDNVCCIHVYHLDEDVPRLHTVLLDVQMEVLLPSGLYFTKTDERIEEFYAQKNQYYKGNVEGITMHNNSHRLLSKTAYQKQWLNECSKRGTLVQNWPEVDVAIGKSLKERSGCSSQLRKFQVKVITYRVSEPDSYPPLARRQ